MADICLGPFAPKQRLFLQTEEGLALEGLFFRFNPSQTSILLHQVERVPPDGRVFEQQQVFISELVCLKPLGPPKETPNQVTNGVEEKADPITISSKEISSNQAHSPRSISEDETLPKTRLTRAQLLAEAMKKLAVTNGTPVTRVRGQVLSDTGKKNVCNGKRSGLSSNRDCSGRKARNDVNMESKPNATHLKVGEISGIHPAVSDPVYEEMKKKVVEHIFFDNFSSGYQDAMKDIAQQTIIGVGSHGAERGRRNRLSILSVVTEKAVYLFDIQTLGKRLWQGGLRTVLESSTVEKVICDCRLLSDCLQHSHAVKLENVYDLQAADCIICRCRFGQFTGRGRGLPELISQYLHLPAAVLADTMNITNYQVWYQRPLPSGCQNYAAWQVVFLLQLRAAIDQRYHSFMRNSFDVYLNSFRSLTASELFEAQSKIRRVPTEQLDPLFNRDN